MAVADRVGVLILGGGEATRLPGKLELHAGALPLIVRVFRNVSPGRETFISCKATFPPDIDAELTCPMVVDRWTRRGPLAGMLSTLPMMRSPLVFVVAGDAPLVTGAFIDRLAARWEPGIEAIVPRHGERIEPLAAIYDRRAFLRVGTPILTATNGAPRLVIAALRTNYLDLHPGEPAFANVNTPAEYAAVHEAFR